jgi:hypothetical protein
MDTASSSDILTYVIAGAAALLLILLIWIVRKNRRMAGDHVFRASRLTKGNRLFPAQVAITPTSLTLRHPQWIGKLEESVHIAHISSIQIDTNLLFSDVSIETTGGHNPLVCHGHTKGDAIRMKAIIEEIQSQHYKKHPHH